MGVLPLVPLVLVLALAAPGKRSPAEPKIRRVVTGLAEVGSPAAMFAPDTAPPSRHRTIEERMRAYQVPGVGVAVVEDGRVEWARSWGVSDVRTGAPVTDATLFQAASASKLVTAAIVLHGVDAGVLDLDADVNGYLRSWKVPASDSAAGARVTLRLLLTHRAGINRPAGGFSSVEGAPPPTLVQVLKGEPPATNAPAAVEARPGRRWEYSNMGYAIVQAVLEDVMGRPFDGIARRIVFEPLGLSRSTFARPLPAGAVEVAPHDAKGTPHAPLLPAGAVAQGGLMTTPAEFAAFAAELMRAWRGESDRVLSTGMAGRLFSPEVELDPGLFGLPMSEGLGAFLYRGGRELVFLHPGGNEPGANCWVAGCPATGQAAVVMTNGAMGEVLAMEILASIMREYEWPVAR